MAENLEGLDPDICQGLFLNQKDFGVIWHLASDINP